MAGTEHLRIATYNIHKCRGLDRRVSPARIVEVLREVNADVIALQEVLSIEGGRREDDQARFIAEALEMGYRLGENRRLRGGAYGNVVLSRWRFCRVHNFDISVPGREPRGCLHAEVEAGKGHPLHVYNVHLGTAFIERRHQARKLVAEEILNNQRHAGPRVMLGDFNEWTRGLASKLLAAHFQCADIRLRLRRAKTYPGVFPFLHLDHIYFDRGLELEGATLHKSRLALVASDHLPLFADFRLAARAARPDGEPKTEV